MGEDAPLPPGLYLVGTPIGNREELSPRAVAILRTVDAIACEDTRHTQRLLQPLDIHRPLLAYHEHNETAQAEVIARRIAAGERLALVTDAGMPGISDPGFRAVRACRAQGLPVIPISGPSAAVVALAASGLPTDGYLFAGFLAPKSAARQRFLSRFADFEYTLVLYESTHRIEKLLEDIVAVLGPERCVALARELTKLHETFHVGPAARVLEALRQGSSKGEFVVCIAKAGYQL